MGGASEAKEEVMEEMEERTGKKNDRARAAPRAVLSGFLLLLKMSDLI